jgi:SAM-dependent methyltransferase
MGTRGLLESAPMVQSSSGVLEGAPRSAGGTLAAAAAGASSEKVSSIGQRIPSHIPDDWWDNGAGFFGANYMCGDNSVEGYLPEHQELLEERTRREVDGVERILELEPFSRVVDVPCGYGRHSIELSNRWYEVIGVDINEQHLNAAREKVTMLPARQHPKYPGFAKRKNTAQFINQDMRTLCDALHEPSDALINMFYSFGFFASDADNVRTMQQFHMALKGNGGKFLMHTDVSPEMFAANHYRMSEARTLRDGGKLYIEENFDPETKRMTGVWIINRNGQETVLTPYSVRLYSTVELRTMARHVGFRRVTFFGSFMGDPFHPESAELVMVAER